MNKGPYWRGVTPPRNPKTGDCWYNTNIQNDGYYFFDGELEAWIYTDYEGHYNVIEHYEEDTDEEAYERAMSIL